MGVFFLGGYKSNLLFQSSFCNGSTPQQGA